MGKERIPKDLFYGELKKGTRKTGCPLLSFKDVCKRGMKSAAIDIKVGILWATIAAHSGIF